MKICNCLLGFLNFGGQPHNLDTDEYIKFMLQDSPMMEKHFKRFAFCPRCGRKLEWRECHD